MYNKNALFRQQMRRLICVIVLIRYKQFLYRLGSNLCQRLKIKRMNVGFTANIQQYYSNAEHPPIMSKQGGMYWLRLYTVLRQGGGASEKSVIILNW